MRYAAEPGDRLRFSGFRERHSRRLASVRAVWLLANSPRRANFFADFRTPWASRAALDVAPRMRHAPKSGGGQRCSRFREGTGMPVADPGRLISEHTALSAAFSHTLVHSDVRPLISPSPARANRPNPMVGWNTRDFANSRPKGL